MCLGIPGRIVGIRDEDGLPMGTVDFGGAQRDVCLAYVSKEAVVGDYVIVHVGFAISKVDEEEAQRTLRLLRQGGNPEEMGEEASAGPLEGDADPGASGSHREAG